MIDSDCEIERKLKEVIEQVVIDKTIVIQKRRLNLFKGRLDLPWFSKRLKLGKHYTLDKGVLTLSNDLNPKHQVSVFYTTTK